MYKVIKIEKLKDCLFKEYKNGWSKKVDDITYDFLDINFENLIVNKVKYKEGIFIYQNAEKADIKDLIKRKIVKEVNNEN